MMIRMEKIKDKSMNSISLFYKTRNSLKMWKSLQQRNTTIHAKHAKASITSKKVAEGLL
jgi:hypothetical protein